MKFLPLLFVVISATVFAQAPDRMPRAFTTSGDDEQLPLSREGLRGDRATIVPSGLVSNVGVGAMARINAASSGLSTLQVSAGYLVLRQGAQSNLEGNGVFASVVPMYLGGRTDFAEFKSGQMEWTQYVAYGAGPVVGIEHPTAYSLWQSVSRMSFRWGAGAYAGVGSELRFSQGLGMYAQLEYTAFGFTSPLRGKQSFTGPSFSFGILLVP